MPSVMRQSSLRSFFLSGKTKEETKEKEERKEEENAREHVKLLVGNAAEKTETETVKPAGTATSLSSSGMKGEDRRKPLAPLNKQPDLCRLGEEKRKVEEVEEENTRVLEVASAELVDYEKIRKQRLERNRHFLNSLNADARKLMKPSSLDRKKPPKKKVKVKRDERAKPDVQLRRRTRSSTRSAVGIESKGMEQGQDVAAAAAGALVEIIEEPLNFVQSAVADYDTAELKLGPKVEDDIGDSTGASRLRKLSSSHASTSCFRKIYSIDVADGACVVAGEKGMASVYGMKMRDSDNPVSDDLSLDCLLDVKLHRSWISNIQFLSSQAVAGKRLMLSAANDGSLQLWNINKTAFDQKQGMDVPENIDSVYIHSKGIFSMHEKASKIITGSKDCSIGLAVFKESKMECVRIIADAHSSVVKSVRWRNTNEFGSAGNDRDIHLSDLRASGGARVWTASDAHASAINALEFSPSEHLLLSSSFDTAIVVHDLRKGEAPLFELQGHLTRRTKSIYHPVFVDSGRRIVTSGESNLLTLFDVAEGTVVSRGSVDFNPTALHHVDSGGATNGLLMAAGQGELCLLQPLH